MSLRSPSLESLKLDSFSISINKNPLRTAILATLLSGCSPSQPQDPGFGSFNGTQTSASENNSSSTTLQEATSTSEADDDGTSNGPQTSSGTTETEPETSTTEVNSITEVDFTSSSTGNEVVICGNGIKEGDEVCDDGLNDGSYEGCEEGCLEKGPYCGDGINDEEHGEECDDGNKINTDICTNDCKKAVCGDGHVMNGAEECDEGINNNNYGECTKDCKEAECGDGYVQPGEKCDNGDKNNDEYGCGTNCQDAPEWCGDGFLQKDKGEQCDGYEGKVPEIGCKEDCKYDLSQVNQMICGGSCSYAGGQGCDEQDADLMCKLITGQENATAQSYSYEGYVSKATDVNGFGCSDKNQFFDNGEGEEVRINLGQMYGTQIFFVPGDITKTHANMDSITSFICDEI